MTDKYEEILEKRAYQLERFPIFVSDNNIILLTTFHLTEGHKLADIWTYDFVDHVSDIERAAKQLVEQIGDHASIHFWQHVRKAIAEEIQNQNKKWGTNHSIDLKEEDIKAL